MSSIAILVPVLGRAGAIRPLVDSIRDTTLMPWRLLFLCSPGDTEANAVCLAYAAEDPRYRRQYIRQRIVPWSAGAGDWARKINLGYLETTEDYILLGATDLRFHPGWDSAAMAVAGEFGVIGTNDLGNAVVMRGHHSTHPIVRRTYIDEWGTIDEDGKVVHEGYQHQWVDTELCETAMARRQWVFARDCHIEHLHPFWHKGEMDATYEKALSTPRPDHRLYGKRRPLWARARMPA